MAPGDLLPQVDPVEDRRSGIEGEHLALGPGGTRGNHRRVDLADCNVGPDLSHPFGAAQKRVD